MVRRKVLDPELALDHIPFEVLAAQFHRRDQEKDLDERRRAEAAALKDLTESGIWAPEIDGPFIRGRYALLNDEQKSITSGLASGRSVSTIAAQMNISQPRVSLMIRELRVWCQVDNRADLWT